jgi:hypothetical protein
MLCVNKSGCLADYQENSDGPQIALEVDWDRPDDNGGSQYPRRILGVILAALKSRRTRMESAEYPEVLGRMFARNFVWDFFFRTFRPPHS